MPSANRPATLALIILVGIALAATALAQVDGPGGIGVDGSLRTDDPYALTPVDQGTADLGELNTSSRLIPVDLRQPQNFDRLYRAPDGSGRLMRVSGGLSAVFPRSEYAVGPGFILPVIPAGTEFFIGPMPVTGDTYTPPGSSLIDSRLDLGVSLGVNEMTSSRVIGANPPPMRRIHASSHHGITLGQLLTGQPGGEDVNAAPQRPSTPTVWSNERYRQGRIAAMLARTLDHRNGS